VELCGGRTEERLITPGRYTDNSRGDGAMLDGAITFGEEVGRWQRTAIDFVGKPQHMYLGSTL